MDLENQEIEQESLSPVLELEEGPLPLSVASLLVAAVAAGSEGVKRVPRRASPSGSKGKQAPINRQRWVRRRCTPFHLNHMSLGVAHLASFLSLAGPCVEQGQEEEEQVEELIQNR